MKYYDSIDNLPIHHYWRITETGDLKHLIIEGDVSAKELQKAWEQIELGFFDMLVEDEDYILELRKDAEYYALKAEVAVEPNALNRIYLRAEENERSLRPKGQFKYDESIAILERSLKFAIDDKKMSVRRYYTHLRLLKLEAKKHLREKK